MKTGGLRAHSCSFHLKSIGWVAAGLLAVVTMAPVAAQEGGLPPWLDVVVLQVEGGQAAAFEDLLKDFMEARQAAGLPAGQVFQVVIGHPNEYHLVTPVQSITESETTPIPMAEADAALWIARITDKIDSVRFSYAVTFPEHSVQAPANAPDANMMVLRKIVVASGRQADYESWVADQYMPAFRQTDPLGHTMSHSIYGDSMRNYYHAYPLAGWEDLGTPDPLIEILGQRRYDQVFEAIDGIVVEHEMIVARMRTDLMAQ